MYLLKCLLNDSLVGYFFFNLASKLPGRTLMSCCLEQLPTLCLLILFSLPYSFFFGIFLVALLTSIVFYFLLAAIFVSLLLEVESTYEVHD